MPQHRAYVETTIISDALLKPGNPKCTAALAALKKYDETLLPVYAIKEWKAGIMRYFAYFHEKLVQTKSLSRTVQIIAALPDQYHRYRKNTSLEALATAVHLSSQRASTGATVSLDEDKELADRYRYAITVLLMKSWRKRRDLTSKTIQDLDCYTESPPVLSSSGVFDLSPLNCDPERECS
jgi:hypothetical protein